MFLSDIIIIIIIRINIYTLKKYCKIQADIAQTLP